MKKYTIQIQGMHCAGCAANVERSLRKVKGVKSASVSLMVNKGFVEVDNAVQTDELTKAIARTGYRALSVEQGS